MLDFEEQTKPLAPGELVDVTRENSRSVENYQEILAQNSLPSLEISVGDFVLEIGTGQGNAIPGLMSLAGPNGSVVSVDINSKTSAVAFANLTDRYRSSIPAISVSLMRQLTPPLNGNSIKLVEGDISADLELPKESFDISVSIWVFYQILDKLTALQRVISSLKKGGRFYATATGSVAITTDDLSQNDIGWLRERVWNTRASRFSWLTGTRELAHWSNEIGLRIRIMDLPTAASYLFPKVTIHHGHPEPGRPEGAFLLTKNDAGNESDLSVSLLGFITTRSSSVIPIYKSQLLFEADKEPNQ